MVTTAYNPDRARKLLEEAAAWEAKRRDNPANRPGTTPPVEFAAIRAKLLAAAALLPESPQIPYNLTPEGERWAKFKKVCDERFHPKLDYSLIKNRAAFDRIAVAWDGSSPGPCAVGGTGEGKTRAAWWALRRLYVVGNKPFAWFPARRLCSVMDSYESRHCADEFFRAYDFFKVLFVDDVEKINWDFKSNTELLFSFFDWVYRTKKPCVVTTNRGRDWWTDKMGEAFARRLFDEAHFEVTF